jgi:fermentation-respiration switch protein FrsA (DUF1100 family)
VSRLSAYYFGVFVQHQEDVQGVLEKNSALNLTEDEQEILKPFEEAFDSYRNRRLCDRVSVVSSDGTQLAGAFYDEGSDITVISLHAFNGSKDSDFLFAPYYGDKGYNVLMPDARAHGDSEGRYVGYGHFEKEDLLAWIKWVNGTKGSESQIIIHGIAAGASTALLAASEGLPDNVMLLVLDSPYNSLADIVSYQIGKLYGLPRFPFMSILDYKLEKEAGYKMADVDVVAAVRDSEIKIPALFIIGDGNDYIPPNSLIRYMKHIRQRKNWLPFPGRDMGCRTRLLRRNARKGFQD